ncbi:MAG: hypothetical protein PHH11_13430, partial [Methylomonas sp.]|nr:hypothetical protein [Methylomonas sp.]
YTAPSIAAFVDNSPAGKPRVFRGTGKPLRKTLDKSDKFARSKFEEPIGWPAGRKPWMVFVKAQESGGIGAAFSLVSFFSTARCRR